MLTENNQQVTIQLSPLVSKVMSDLQRAISAKQPVVDRMIEAIYAMQNSYTEKKLMEIRADVGGSEVYVPLTNIKIRAGKAWLSDIYADENSIFSLQPTPIPDLPEEVEAKIQAELLMFQEKALSLGIQLDEGAQQAYRERVSKEYLNKIKEHASKLAEKEYNRILDQFVQGGFFNAFSEILYDIVLFPAAILKGPILRKERLLMFSNKTVFESVIPTYNRVNPFDIYPSPTSTNIDSDYLIEILHLTPSDLYNLIGVEGFNEDAIREVLGNYRGGYLSVSAIPYNDMRVKFEGKDYTKGDIIDVIEYWGTVRGEMLIDEGFLDFFGVDPVAYYNVCIWIANNKVLKAMLNPDPLGKKPYCKASFVEIPDSFWGLSIADIVKPIQDAVNSLARASINNAVISSGPLIERNIDRINAISQKQIYPFMIIDAHESAMNSAPAIRFYQPQPTAQQTMLLMDLFQKMASEYSGIPSYVHGVTVGGTASRTASGFAMLQENATRGIKDVVSNIDKNIIEPIVKRQYFFNISYLMQSPEEIPDFQIQAKGIASLVEKQTQATRMLEFLQITSNPIDMQLVGAEGRKYMLETIAKNVGINTEKIFSENPELQQMMQSLLQKQPVTQQLPAPSEEPSNPINSQAQEFNHMVNRFEQENR